MAEDKSAVQSTVTINDETPKSEGATTNDPKTEGNNETSKSNEIPRQEGTVQTPEVVAETSNSNETPKSEGSDTTSKPEETVTSNEQGVTTETAESTTNNAAGSTQTQTGSESESEPKPEPEPIPTPEKADDDEEPWDDDEPITEDDIVDELVYHGGMAKNIAKEMIEKLKAATDTELRASLINHIAWHIATGGPTNKINSGKGKALHKKDIIRVLNNIH